MSVESNKEPVVDIFTAFGVDKKKALQGAAMKLGATTLYVAKANNKNFAIASSEGFAKLMFAFPKKEDRQGDLYQEAHRKMMLDAMAETLLVGWDNLMFKGKLYEKYDSKTARELLELDDFAEAIQLFASDRSNYAPELTEEEVKN